MRMIIAIAFACLALAGCQTATVDEAIAKNLPQVCKAATIAYTAVATVSGKGERRVDAAWRVLQPICVNPHPARRPAASWWLQSAPTAPSRPRCRTLSTEHPNFERKRPWTSKPNCPSSSATCW